MKTMNKSVTRFAFLLFASLAITACGGSGGGGGDDNNGGAGGEAVDNSDNPNVINGFNLSTASLVLSGPTAVGTGSSSSFTATLLDANGIPPASPPGIPVELDVTAGSTNPPGNAVTDNNGDVDFTFLAPNNGNNTVVRARIRNRDGDLVLNQGLTVNVRENIFRFIGPPENTQVRLDASREIRLNWLIGNEGADTGEPNQGNPGTVRLTLEGRVAGGGFSIGGGSVQEPAEVAIQNGRFAQIVEVVAGDAGGPVNVVATSSTNSQNLRAVLPIEFVGVPARIDPTPTNIRLEQQEATPLNVRVFDVNGTPLSNIPLRFSISICIDDQRDTTACTGSGEQITTALRTTDATGRAATGFVAGDGIGGGEIEITVDSGPGAGLESAIVYNVTRATGGAGGGTDGGATGTTQSFTSPAAGTQIPVGERRNVVFNVSDDNGPVAGQAITFSISRGLIDDNPNSAPAAAATRSFTTNGAGNVVFQIFSNIAGAATLSGGSAQVNVEFTAQASANATSISAVPANATVAPGATNSIIATAFDANNDPLPGVFLQFFLESNTAGGSIAPTSGTTNAQGQLTTTFTAGTGTGNVNVRASNQDQSLSFVTNFTVAAGSNAQFTTPANGTVIPTTQPQDVRFVLDDGAAAAGQQVTFRLTRGLIDDDFNAAPNPTTTRTFTADANGVITFGIISFEGGPASLQATGAGSAQLNLEFVAVGSITSRADPQTFPTGQTTTITATARDSSGNPLPGVGVNFIIDFDSSGGATLSDSLVTSNNQGQASITFTAGPNTGTADVRAANGNQSVSGSVRLNITSSTTTPGSNTIGVQANPQTLRTDQSSTITATVRDASGDPVQGEFVQFFVDFDGSNGGGNLSQSNGTSNSLGVVTTTFTAGPSVGSVDIRSTNASQNVAGRITLNVTGTPSDPSGTPRNLSANPGNATLAPNQAQTIAIRVSDNNDDPLQGVVVTFVVDADASGGSLSRTTATTDALGQTNTVFTAGPNTGNVTIRSTVNNGSLSATSNFTVAAAPASGGGGSFSRAANSRISVNQNQNIQFSLDGGASAAGQQVTLTTNLGQIDDNGGSATAPAASRNFTAGSDGSFIFRLISDQAGAATLTASGAASTQLPIEFVAASSIGLQANPQSPQTGDTSVITATTRDSSNRPIPNAPVTFSIDSGNGSLNRGDATSTDQGVSASTFTAGANAGNVVIRVTSRDGSGVSQTITLNVQ